MVPPVTLSSTSGYVADWQNVQKSLSEFSYVTASAPFVNGNALLNYGGTNQPVIITGILPQQEKNVTELSKKMSQGQLTNLQAGKFGIVLGQDLADHLSVNLGDKVTVMTPQVSLTPVGVIPRYKQFTVVGIFNAGNGFGFDSSLAFLNLTDAQKLFGLGNNVTGLHLYVNNVYAAPRIAQQLTSELSQTASVTTWADQFGEFFHAIALEKTMMFLILMMIIAVAAFNLVSTLIMIVSEKESDIAILRTFGATPRMIMTVFMIQGGIVGILGTLLGVIGGVILALNATNIVNGIQDVFHVQFLSSNIYFVNYLPSKIEWWDVFRICIASLLLSLLATIYPAWRASKTDPVESLRYE